jgi:hypothetical protein
MKAPGLPWGTLLILGLIYLLCAQGRIGNSDSSSMLAVCRSLLEGHVHVGPLDMGQPGVGGRVSQFGVLIPLLWLPFVLAGRALARLPVPLSAPAGEELMVSFFSPLVMVGFLMVLADLWRRCGASQARIRSGLWVLGLTTILWPYAKLPGSDVITGLLGLLAVRAWLGPTVGSQPNYLRAGLFLGFMLMARKQAQSLVPLFVLVWLLDAVRGQRWSMGWQAAWQLGVGALPGVAGMTAYNWVRFGRLVADPYPRGDQGTETLEFLGWRAWIDRGVGLIGSGGSGLLWYGSVLIVVAVLAVPRMRREAGALGCLLGALFLGQFGLVSYLPIWQGGTTFGPRLLLPVLLWSCVTWAFLPQLLKLWQRWALGLAMAVGLAIMVPGVLTDPLPVQARADEILDYNLIVARWEETAVVLKLANRPAAHQKNHNLVHPPFQVPDFWWCQVIQTLQAKPKATANPVAP